MQNSGASRRPRPKRIFSRFRHFPFLRKRFMVPRGFATGMLELSFNIKGLACALSLWRAV
jgi:hypothetical protein